MTRDEVAAAVAKVVERNEETILALTRQVRDLTKYANQLLERAARAEAAAGIAKSRGGTTAPTGSVTAAVQKALITGSAELGHGDPKALPGGTGNRGQSGKWRPSLKASDAANVDPLNPRP